MTCPYCGSEMRHGEITAHNTIIRWIEGDKPKSKLRKLFSVDGGKAVEDPTFCFRSLDSGRFLP